MSTTLMGVLADHALAGVPGPAGVELSLAFGAGILSTLNPCGFALLPAYVSYAVKQQVAASSDQQPSGWQHLLRGGLLGLPLAAGFLMVFLVAGFMLALGGRLLVHLFPWLAVLVGTGLVFLGGWTLFTGRAPEIPGLGAVGTQLGTSRPGGPATSETLVQAPPHAMRAAWVFGLGYGLSSLGCTLPVFLLVVGTTITAGGVGSAALVLASYAAGMTLVLLAVALAATELSDLLRSAVFPLLRWVLPLASLFFPAALTIPAETVEPEQVGVAYAMFFMARVAGMLLGPVLIGAVLDLSSAYGAYLGVSAITLAGLLASTTLRGR